jgi:hypothetical protein
MNETQSYGTVQANARRSLRPPKKFKCISCWEESDEALLWIYFGFKSLESGWLCVPCQPVWQLHFQKLQVGGL